MIKISVKFDQTGLQRRIQEMLIEKTNELVNKKVAPIRHEILQEPNGKFEGRFQGNQILVKPVGFSPELTEKINQLIS